MARRTEAVVAGSVGIVCGLVGSTWLSGTLMHLLWHPASGLVSFASAMFVMIVSSSRPRRFPRVVRFASRRPMR
jgi:hypothetical protein